MSIEIKNNTIELTDEEAEKAAGGRTAMSGSTTCKNCEKTYSYVLYDGNTATPKCPYCGYAQND